MNKIRQLENQLCLQGQTVYLNRDLKGIFFTVEEFQKMLELVGEVINEQETPMEQRKEFEDNF